MVYTLADGTQMTRRKKVVLTGAASGALAAHQLKLTVLWEAAMQADYDCVRFTQSDMQTLIDAWLESKTDSTTADIWAEFPTTPADGVVKTEAYMYFGNAVVANYWDIFDTFVVGDDFTTKSPEPWTEVDPNNHIVIDRTTDERVEITNLARNEDAYIYQTKTTDSIVIYSKIKVAGADDGQILGFIGVSDTLNDMTAWQNGVGIYAYFTPHTLYIRGFSGGSATQNGVGISVDTDYWLKLIVDGTTGTMYVYSDSARNNLVGSASTTVGDVSYSYIYGIFSYNTGNADFASGIEDDIRVRKYAANPPTAALGTEEHQRRTPMMM